MLPRRLALLPRLALPPAGVGLRVRANFSVLAPSRMLRLLSEGPKLSPLPAPSVMALKQPAAILVPIYFVRRWFFMMRKANSSDPWFTTGA